jgi:DNA-binding response OmpR family regulator
MRRLLLVEDDDANRLTLGALLEGEGFVVTEAASFAEAESRIRTESFDVVVLDRGLGGRDGIDLVPIANAATKPARIVIVSGADAVARVAGVDAWVVKGGSVSQLVEVIRAIESGAAVAT